MNVFIKNEILSAQYKKAIFSFDGYHLLQSFKYHNGKYYWYIKTNLQSPPVETSPGPMTEIAARTWAHRKYGPVSRWDILSEG